MNDNTPILIGAGTITARKPDPDNGRSPITMMADAARAAADDCGNQNILQALDSLTAINFVAPRYANPPALVSELLGIKPAEMNYTTIGGNTPQWLVGQYADRIASGEIQAALICGCETQASQRKGLSGPKHDATKFPPANVIGDNKTPITPYEARHSLQLPNQIYPLFENAIRAKHGWSVADHQQNIGELYVGINEVAVQNEQAWFRNPATADELTTPDEKNRMIAWPYTKRLNALMTVDQSAALIMTSVGKARELGIAEDRWVYVHGSADCSDQWFVSERNTLAESPAIKLAAETALAQAETNIDDIDYLDIYSCFPCAVQIGRDALGISADDPRPLSVTGGLAYHGGPGNNYVTHSIATMIDKLRAKPGSRGLVTAVGWYLTKHAVGIYSTEAPEKSWQRKPQSALQAEIEALEVVGLLEEASGEEVSIETYTVQFDNRNQPMVGIIVARLDDGRRVLANSKDRELLTAMCAEEFIGRGGTVEAAGKINLFTLQ